MARAGFEVSMIDFYLSKITKIQRSDFADFYKKINPNKSSRKKRSNRLAKHRLTVYPNPHNPKPHIMQPQPTSPPPLSQTQQTTFPPQNHNSSYPVNIFNQQPHNPLPFPPQTHQNTSNQAQEKIQAIDPKDITITQVQENPLDSVQMIKWIPGQNIQNPKNCFAVCGWDGCVRVYSMESEESPNGQKMQILRQEIECFLGEPV